MSNLSQMSRGGRGGNNHQPAPRDRKRKYIFTLNNWSEDEKKAILDFFVSKKCIYIIGDEIGEEKGTPHLQGFVEFKHQVEFSTLQKLAPRARWKNANGKAHHNLDYCSKDANYVTNMKLTKKLRILKLYENTIWKPWQQNIIDIVKGPKDPRKIYWFWEAEGNTGKSYLTKYLFNRYKCILGEGKRADVLNNCLGWQEKNPDDDPDLIIIDIPRTVGSKYISYSLIEKLKDGLAYSGKYEGGTVQFVVSPHIIIFANEPPLYDNMSRDRWEIHELN